MFHQLMTCFRSFAEKFSLEIGKPVLMMFDCSPQFSRFTQMAIASSNYLITPLTPDILSLQGLKNVLRLVYHQGDLESPLHMKFPNIWLDNMKHHQLPVPKLLMIPKNRWPSRKIKGKANYTGKTYKEWKAVQKLSQSITQITEDLQRDHPISVDSSWSESSCHLVGDLAGAAVISLRKAVPLALLQERIDNCGQDPLPPYSYRTNAEFVGVYDLNRQQVDNANQHIRKFTKTLITLLQLSQLFPIE